VVVAEPDQNTFGTGDQVQGLVGHPLHQTLRVEHFGYLGTAVVHGTHPKPFGEDTDPSSDLGDSF
jgi:hypothetical protein